MAVKFTSNESTLRLEGTVAEPPDDVLLLPHATERTATALTHAVNVKRLNLRTGIGTS
jgi:hypothetical protein